MELCVKRSLAVSYLYSQEELCKYITSCILEGINSALLNLALSHLCVQVDSGEQGKTLDET